MFGKREAFGNAGPKTVAPPSSRPPERPSVPATPAPRAATPPPPVEAPQERRKSEEYYDTKSSIFSALIETIDLSQLSKLDLESLEIKTNTVEEEFIKYYKEDGTNE